MGRSWLADEQWGKKVQEGREAELCKCINCLRCFESLNQWNAAGPSSRVRSESPDGSGAEVW